MCGAKNKGSPKFTIDTISIRARAETVRRGRDRDRDGRWVGGCWYIITHYSLPNVNSSVFRFTRMRPTSVALVAFVSHRWGWPKTEANKNREFRFRFVTAQSTRRCHWTKVKVMPDFQCRVNTCFMCVGANTLIQRNRHHFVSHMEQVPAIWHGLSIYLDLQLKK